MAKYKSGDGCCICGIKSSNSRFTSSIKYAEDFESCFQVEKRSGDICNPCVLSVKRWRKTPNKSFSHMVDKKRNGGPRNLKTIMKREKKAMAKTIDASCRSARRKPANPMQLSKLQDFMTDSATKNGPCDDTRSSILKFFTHRQRCRPDKACRHSPASIDCSYDLNEDDDNDQTSCKETVSNCNDTSSVTSKHEIGLLNGETGVERPTDTGDESGIDCADFESMKSFII